MSAAAINNADDYARRVALFKDDLSTSIDLVTLIRKHITTGDPAAIDRTTYFELRRQVGEAFNLHPSSIVLVGSGRMGFSLKAKGSPQQRYHPFSSGSDIDVAVVSSSLFTSYWDAVFGLVRSNHDWTFSNGKYFVRDLFCGWVTPQDLPNLPRFDNAKRWTEFFDGVTRSRLCGIRAISARLYRDWSRLEAYQERLVSVCRSEIRRARTRGDRT